MKKLLLFILLSACNAVDRGEPRSDPETCDRFRPSDEVTLGRTGCTSHSDCVDGANGRCWNYPGPGGEFDGNSCTYDMCFSDEDCESGMACSCGGDEFFDHRLTSDANRCVEANCRANFDCSGEEICRVGFSDCQDELRPIVGYFCSSDRDRCATDADCSNGYCTFDSLLSAFACLGADCD